MSTLSDWADDVFGNADPSNYEKDGQGLPDIPAEAPGYSFPEKAGKWLEARKGTNIGLPIIYGTRRTGGILIYTEVSINNNLLYRIYALAEGVQQAWTLYVDEVAVVTCG